MSSSDKYDFMTDLINIGEMSDYLCIDLKSPLFWGLKIKTDFLLNPIKTSFCSGSLGSVWKFLRSSIAPSVSKNCSEINISVYNRKTSYEFIGCLSLLKVEVVNLLIKSLI